MRSTRRALPTSSPARQKKAEVLRTLQVICANLRELQTSTSATAVYRDVEALLGREIARLRPAPGRRPSAPSHPVPRPKKP